MKIIKIYYENGESVKTAYRKLSDVSFKVVRSRKLDLKQKWIILLSRIALLLLKG